KILIIFTLCALALAINTCDLHLRLTPAICACVAIRLDGYGRTRALPLSVEVAVVEKRTVANGQMKTKLGRPFHPVLVRKGRLYGEKGGLLAQMQMAKFASRKGYHTFLAEG
ncbi:hypothetical protein NQ315_016773, partial [Exocentrus adspersus]